MSKTTNFNISFYTTLFMVFFVLKLTGQIDWSWWWVTSPLWLPAAIVFLAIMLMATVSVIWAMVMEARK